MALTACLFNRESCSEHAAGDFCQHRLLSLSNPARQVIDALIPRVLLVNDDPASLFALESLLLAGAQRLEYELFTARTGEAALRLVLRHEFAVILLDVNMPGMDGFETAEAIHSHPRSHGVPIIFVTAQFADELSRLKAYQKGAADYLFTPVIPQILQTKVGVFVELTKKNMQLQLKSEQLANLNQDLRGQRVQDLERSNHWLKLEVAERKLAEQRAHELSTRDVLTGLVNRRSLIQQLEHAVASADRQQGEFALLFLDLDKFKAVNDTLGHEVGDELLRQVAARLTAAVRVSDVVARLGGDEFVVLVEGSAAAANAARVATKIAHAQSRRYQIGSHRIKTSTSIGIAIYPQDGGSAQLLMKNADLAMYHAKQEKRGSFKFFHEELNVLEKERSTWRAELHHALENTQFELLYQPMAGIADARIKGVEAQLYWRHPRLGLIAAAQFLPGVPDRSLLDLIDDWSMAAVCAQAAAWRGAIPPGLTPPIALNLCAVQPQPDLARRLLEHLHRYRLGPASIELEMAEPLLCGTIEPALRELHAAGVWISVDNFGSAGTSLALCKNLPLKSLKIDHSFIDAIGVEDGAADMLAAIIHMARALAIQAVALGVSSAAQLAVLAALGCDQYQGDLFCAPLPAAALQERLRQAAA